MDNKQRLYTYNFFIILLAVILYFIPLPAQAAIPDTSISSNKTDGIQFTAKVEGRDFYVYSNGSWHKKFLKGVNMGVGKPGAFPGEFAITKAEYLRWFQYISDMNADVIRVYTTLKPDFYDALYEFNKTAKKPLYLLQGVYLREDLITKLDDAYADHEAIKKDFIKTTQDLVDIFHGQAKLPEKLGFASGEYKSDISEYVIGWVLGIEWDPMFVIGTIKGNSSKRNYNGKFLYTDDASPFETFLCEVGDQVVTYEAEKYKMMRPLSYTNWLTTDTLKHPNEPYINREDKVEVNTEHIKYRSEFKPGMFASYHVYPYYPDFLNYQREYVNFKDDSGRINTYRAYLRDLFKHHTRPVLVAEFGVPAARGMAHESIYSGYNQGRHDEREQGRIVTSLLQDIYAEGYCGGIIFTWQDEWFKKVWNTMHLDLPSQRPLWSNSQANEQQFGLLGFDPGKDKTVCDVDGDIVEWQNDKPIYVNDKVELYAKSDEKYLYLMAKTNNFDFANDSLYITIDLLAEQGNSHDTMQKLKFTRPAEFLLQIQGEKNSKILVDAYYDSFYYTYAEKSKSLDKKPSYRKKDSGTFNSMNLCTSNAIYLPQDNKYIPFKSDETGILQYGDANPAHEKFNSLTDFSFKNGNLEIRIPWQLLNIMDPSTKTAMADFYSNKGKKVESNFPKDESFMNFDRNDGIKSQIIEGMYIGAAVVKQGQLCDEPIGMGYYTWKPWILPTFHERLKKSYYILQKTFKELEEKENSRE